MRLVWTTLQEEDEVALAKLADIFRLVDRYESMAESNLKSLLSKYPRSIRILRAMGAFVEEVKNDALRAEEYYRLADAEEEDQSRATADGAGGDGAPAGAIDNTRNGVIVIGSNEIITSVNAVTCRMWGYKRNEIVGKRITMMMPSPFRDDHHIYVTSYLRTGVAKVVNIPRNVFGLHKDGHIFPIRLYVTRMDINGSITFVGAVTQLEDTDGAMLVTAAGKLTGANKEAASIFETPVTELAQKDIKQIVPPRFWSVFDVIGGPQKPGSGFLRAPFGARQTLGGGGSFNRRVGGAVPSLNIGAGAGDRRESNTSKMRDGTQQQGGNALQFASKIQELSETEIQGLSPDGTVFPLSVKLSKMFEGEKTLIIANIKEVEDTAGLISIDARGVIRSLNKSLCVIFGYQPRELINQKIEMLMPAPYSQYHQGYLDRYMRTGEEHVVGQKRTVTGKHKSGATFPIMLEVSRADVGRDAFFVGRVIKLEDEEDQDAMITIDQGGLMQNVNAVCSEMFGYRTQEMLGRNVKMLMPSHYAVHHDKYLSEYMRTGVSHVIGTGGRSLEALHRDGSTFPVQLEVMQDDSLKDKGVTLFMGRISKLTDMDALISINSKGIVTSCNKYACKMFGIKGPEHLVGRNIKVLTPPEIAVNHDAYLKRYMDTGVARVVGLKREVEGLHSDGSRFPLTLEVSEMKVQDDSIFTARILFNAEDYKKSQRSARSGGASPHGSHPAVAVTAPAPAHVPERTGLVQRKPHAQGHGEHGHHAHVHAHGLNVGNFGLDPVVEEGAEGTPRINLGPNMKISSFTSDSSHGNGNRFDPLHLDHPQPRRRSLSIGGGPDTDRSGGSLGRSDGSATDRSAGDRDRWAGLGRGHGQGRRRSSHDTGTSSSTAQPLVPLTAHDEESLVTRMPAALAMGLGLGREDGSGEAGAGGAGAGGPGAGVASLGSGAGAGPSDHDGDERRSEAGQSEASASSIGTKRRRRKRKMELLNAARNRKSGADLLWRQPIVLSVVILSALCVAAFLIVQGMMAGYGGMLEAVAASSQRTLQSQFVAIEARTLDLLARGAAAPSAVDSASGGGLEAAAGRLAAAAAEMMRLHQASPTGPR
eukprot:tig00000317_g24044.t1